jgi:HPt (histidine-containing phosphotransfer) domain-containing protein
VLDYDFLRKLYAKQEKDGSNLVNNIVSIYLEQSSKLLVDLAEATMKSDIETVRTVSHALKSSSANVGALTLSELCRKVELACEQGRIEKSKLQQIHLTYSDVEKALKQVQDDKTILQL